MEDRSEVGHSPIEAKAEDTAMADPSRIRDAMERIAIKTPRELATSVAIGLKAFYGVSSVEAEGASEATDVSLSEETKQRVFIARQLVEWLYKDGTAPENIVELCSAGDTSLALAFPDTQILSVDFDKDHFLSHSNNTLPLEVFQAIGMQKSHERWRRGDKKEQERKLAVIQKVLPNFHPVVANAMSLRVSDNSIDMAVIQNQTLEAAFLEELARVIKPGGFVVAVSNQYEPPETQSRYEAGIYDPNQNTNFFNGDMARLARIRDLHQVEIPEHLRQYEHLGITVQDNKGKLIAPGVVFQVFKKGSGEQARAESVQTESLL